jgi:HEAT repeat protein
MAIVAASLLAGTGSIGEARNLPGVKIVDGKVRDVPVQGTAGVLQARVKTPRVWMGAVDALVTAHRQSGLRYAILPDQFEGSVGPFDIEKGVTVEKLVERIAAATGTGLRWINNVAVFEPPEPSAVETLRNLPPLDRISRLEGSAGADAVALLTELAGQEDASVRFHALAALQRIEGDFVRNTYPGRASILEVLADRIDSNNLLYALEAAGPAGSRQWKLAVEAMGRARTRVLCRHVWDAVWTLQDGTVEIGMWALGRCGDPSAGFALSSRVRRTDTNDPSHHYLAAMALGQVDRADKLDKYATSRSPDERREAAFGLGFCAADNKYALKLLAGLAEDGDRTTQALALQSLARIGSPETVGKARDAAMGKDGPSWRRASALDALASMGFPGGCEIVAELSGDADSMIRSRAAAAAADVGAPHAGRVLSGLVEDGDRMVRCAALCSLAAMGTADGIAAADRALTSPESDPDTQIAALLGLGRSRSPEAVEPLARIASDAARPMRIRQYAVLGLARVHQPAAIKPMSSLADADNPESLPIAVRLLNLASARETAERLIPLLTHHANRSRACAAAGRLAELGYGPAVVELLEGSNVFDNHTRMMHMSGALKARGGDVLPALCKATENPRADIRLSAVSALGGRLQPEASGALRRLADDSSESVRIAVALALGVTPDPAAVDTLIEMAQNDKSDTVGREAARALRRRDYRSIKRVRECLAAVAGTARDPGGTGDAPPPADQPANTFVLRSWDDHVEEDIVCNLTYESSLCYDSRRGRIVMWGSHGRRYDTPQTGQTWFYDTAANRWERLVQSRHWPNGTCCVRGTVFDDANGAVVSPRSGGQNSHGWHNALRANLTQSSPWVLDVATDQWYAANTLTTRRGGMIPGSHDPFNGVNLWWSGDLFGFDVYGNRWFDLDVKGQKPASPGSTGGVFDPLTGRFIAVATASTWAFDPASGEWTDLKPEGPHPPACPMVYDKANDVMLAFKLEAGKVSVLVYHPRENRWEALPAAKPFPCNDNIWDAAYDEVNNVVVISGQSLRGLSASLTARETWTYRYRPRTDKSPAAPLRSPSLRCMTAADGSVELAWAPVEGAKAAGHRIERMVADYPWQGEWSVIGTADGNAASFVHRPPDKAFSYYRITVLDSEGKAALPGLPCRTAPRILSRVYATVRADGVPEVQWEPSAETDIAGYRVYRAPVEAWNAWEKEFDPKSVAGSLESATPEPISGTTFVDSAVKVQGTANALSWPRSYAYVVKAVNRWGIESGASPVTLALPDPPGPVCVVPWADGRRLVVWTTCLGRNVSGFQLMRMDDWNREYVFSTDASPLPAPLAWDGEATPMSDRRRYYASGMDGIGTTGIPTSGAWSHGFP